MPDVVYTIYNNSTNTTATISFFEMDTNESVMEHRLKIPVTWLPPFNASPYTDFANTTTLTVESRQYVSHVGNKNYQTTATTTGTFLYLNSNAGIGVGWKVENDPNIIGTQTVLNVIGTQTIQLTFAPDVVPFSSGETITFIPPEYILDIDDTTGLQPSWGAFGNGFTGQTILTVTSSTRLVMSNQPTTTPATGTNIDFKSLNDVMVLIPPLSNQTFSMDYNRLTSSYGTYASTVTINAILGTAVAKIINNVMTVYPPPPPDPPPPSPPPSPYYDPTPAAPVPPPVTDSGSAGSSGGTTPTTAPTPTGTTTDPGGGGGLTSTTTSYDDGSTITTTRDDSGQIVSVTSTPATDTAPGTGTGSPCYLTTAATIYYDKDDNCDELQSARALRDIAILKNNKNKMFVELYYKIAPIIVQRKSQWEDVYKDTLVPLVDLYKDGKYDDAIKLYKREIGKLIGQHITYKDKEIIEFTFDKLFRFKKLPYMVKVIVLRILLWYQMTFKL